MDDLVVGEHKFSQSEKVDLLELVDVDRVAVFVEISGRVLCADGYLFLYSLDAFFEVIGQF